MAIGLNTTPYVDIPVLEFVVDKCGWLPGYCNSAAQGFKCMDLVKLLQ
jgi:hypothetical protein